MYHTFVWYVKKNGFRNAPFVPLKQSESTRIEKSTRTVPVLLPRNNRPRQPVRTVRTRCERIAEMMPDCVESSEIRLTPSQLHRIWQQVAVSPIARDLPDEQLTRLLVTAEVRSLLQDTSVIRQGQYIARAYLILHGAVEASTINQNGEHRVVGVRATGALIGDRCLIDGVPCPVTYRAMGVRTTALRFTRRGLDQALANNPDADLLLLALRRHGHDRTIRPS